MSPVDATSAVARPIRTTPGRASTAGTVTERDIGSGDEHFAPRRYPAIVDRWALVVGISRYAHAPWNLDYAHADAEAFAEFIATPAGGGFEADKIELLVDDRASTAALTRRLRSFLKRPARDDIVMLYVACHGAPDPDRPDNLYLLTHDTEPDDISGTALPMREITVALTQTLRAERILVFVDTCYSGDLTLARGTRNTASATGIVRSHLDELGKSNPGIAFLTSSDHDQTSRESEKWGKGHGVFTHFLLEGLRGKADGYGGGVRDGRVRVGELFDYVCESVKNEIPTQHPTTGRYPFDREMLVATTGQISAAEHLAQAHRLEHLARRVQEPGRFREAARHYAEAREFAQGVGEAVVDEELGYGRCLLQAGDVDEAIGALERLLRRHPDRSLPKAWFYLAVAHARRFDYARAGEALDEVLAAEGHHENSAWVADYRDWLERRRTGRRVALLIGIDRYAIPAGSLAGCTNDARLLAETLERDGLFDETRVLLDAEATRQGILMAITSLGAGLGPGDQLWITYSGHSVPEKHRRAGSAELADDYLLVHDSVVRGDGYDRTISARELHETIAKLPAGRKTLVLDTHPSTELIALAENDGDYTLLLGSDSAELAFETTVELDGREVKAGLFTTALVRVLRAADTARLTLGELHARTLDEMQTLDRRQTPLLVGDRERPAFGVEDVYLAALDLAKRRDHGTLTRRLLEGRVRRIGETLEKSYPEYHYGVGHARFHFGDVDGAIRSFGRALAERDGDYPEASLLLARARLALRDDDGARAALTEQIFHEPAQARLVRAALGDLDDLRADRRRALLVGVDRTGDDGYDRTSRAVVRERDASHGAAPRASETLERMRRTLTREWGFTDDDVRRLEGRGATRAALLAAFRTLVGEAERATTYFHFVGRGLIRADGSRALVCAADPDADDDERAEVTLAELATMAEGTGTICVIDALWRHGAAGSDDASGPEKSVPSLAAQTASAPTSLASTHETREASTSTGFGAYPTGAARGSHGPARAEVAAITRCEVRIGAITIVAERRAPPREESPAEARGSVTRTFRAPPLDGDGRDGSRGGLSDALATITPDVLARVATVQDWVSAACSAGGLATSVTGEDGGEDCGAVTVLGNPVGRRLFENVLLRERCEARLIEIDREPLEELIGMLERLIEERSRHGDRCAWGFVNIGVAESERGRPEAAVTALAEAVSRYARDGKEPAQLAEARYLLGRTLYRARVDLPRAVDALQKALDHDPDDPHVLFHLGRAMMEMIVHETREKAHRHLLRYLELGAPLGREKEVRGILGSRLDESVVRAMASETEETITSAAGGEGGRDGPGPGDPAGVVLARAPRRRARGGGGRRTPLALG